MKARSLRFYTGVFLISGLVMMLQILQSRLYSVTSWYHLSFLVISMAMFGLTLGALKIYNTREDEQRKNYGAIARRHALFFGGFILVALFFQLYIALSSTKIYLIFLTLPTAAIATSIAYYHAGVVITTCLTRSPYPIGRVYGVDLLGAGLGCISALVLMETLDTPSAILFVSGVAFLCALLFETGKKGTDTFVLGHKTFTQRKAALFLCVFVFLVAGFNAAVERPFIYPVWVKDTFKSASQISYEKWNSISRVTLMNEEKNAPPFLWGPSPLTPWNERVNAYFLVIDGDAGTYITQFDGDFSKHSYLEYDVTNIAYSLPDLQKAVIIGVGGGRDLMSAKYFGLDQVTALDVNPVQIYLLKDHPYYSQYANLHDLQGVSLVNKEARSWFRQNTEKVDLIEMSLIDTWAATGAGAFALSENGLYTSDAWKIFLDDLSDHGVFTVSRWSTKAQDDAARIISLAVSSLLSIGVQDVTSHIALFHCEHIATLVVSKSPFTDAQLDAMEETSAAKQFNIILSPRVQPENEVMKALLSAKNLQEILAISDTQSFDISPPSDMRPFFFNQARLSNPLEVLRLMSISFEHNLSPVAMGQVKATFNLFVIIIFSLLMVVSVIVIPLLKTVEDKGSLFVKAGTLYFILIGLGFMLIEISLLQALGIFLGHPIYGLSVVLFSLIISAGVGSLLSDKIPLKTLPMQMIWCLLVCGYALFLAIILPRIFVDYAEMEISNRVLLSVAIIFPAGALMGFGFPTGLSLTEKFDTRATAWFWGINGAAGVLGSSIGIAFNIAIGIDKTLMIGGFCYALLCLSFLGLALAAKKKI